jgi:hypothetical protein
MKLLPAIFFILSCAWCRAQTGSEIFLFDLKLSNGKVTLSNGTNITNHKGYDNQPSFHPSQPIVYYSSFDDSSRSDIKFYNYNTNETNSFTVTREREYSPTVTPDENFISCIIQRDNGEQDLGKYPLKGGTPLILINDLKIGYHAWASAHQLLLFVLTDSITNTLHYYDLPGKKDTILAKNIGRSLHKIPGQNAMSFIQRVPGKPALIQRFDLSTGAITTVTSALPGSDYLTWLQNNILVMSDGRALFSYQVGKDKDWQPVLISGDVSMLKGVTRLAANSTNTKLAVVVNE